jgi:hypothetical protein
MRRATAHAPTMGDWLLLAAALWSVVVFVAAVALPSDFGYGVLLFAVLPIALTAVTALLIRASRATNNTAFRAAALVPIGFVSLAVLVSFVPPMLALLPTCALLASACFEPAAAGSVDPD